MLACSRCVERAGWERSRAQWEWDLSVSSPPYGIASAWSTIAARTVRLAVGTFSRWCVVSLCTGVRPPMFVGGCVWKRSRVKRESKHSRVCVMGGVLWRGGARGRDEARQRRRLRLGRRRRLRALVAAPPATRQPTSGPETSTHRYYMPTVSQQNNVVFTLYQALFLSSIISLNLLT